MADYSTPIFLSQVQDMSHTSSDNEEDNSPRSVPPLSVCVGPAATSRRIFKPKIPTTITTYNNKIGQIPVAALAMVAAEEHHQHHDDHDHMITPKKPRGRPPGSKNKAKSPVYVTKESETAMRPAILEISAGSDVVDMVVQYARRWNVGVTVLSGSGSITNVTLRSSSSSSSSPAAALTLHGTFNILTLTGTYLSSSTSSSSPPPSCCCFGVTLAGANGQVYGGVIGGKVLAASNVTVLVATFQNPIFHNLPAHFEQVHHQDDSPSNNAAAAAAVAVGGGGGGGGCEITTAMSLYNHQVPVAAPTPLNNCHMVVASTSAHQDMHSWGPGSTRPPPF